MSYSEPVRILHIGTFQEGKGGAESFIMNVYKAIDRSLIQFDFLIDGPVEKCSYKNEIENLGGKIFSRLSRRKHPIKSILYLHNFFKKNPDYSIVHLHACSTSYLDPLIIAKKYAVPVRILHSHNTQHCGNPLFFYIIQMFNRLFFNDSYNYKFACSHDAGRWMFPNSQYQIFFNGIDVERFTFCGKNRTSYRKKLALENSFVIGHVGRFTSQKNHTFLCEIFLEIYKKNKKAVLLLIGSGELQKKIEQKVNKMGIASAVHFLGVREDVPELMHAMDLLLLPSLYEGLPFTLIEAQASGVHCIVSDVISRESKLTNNIEYLPLDKGATYWANYCLSSSDSTYDRRDSNKLIKDSKFNINHTARILEKFYLKYSIKI